MERKLKVKIFDHTNIDDSRWQKRFEICNSIVKEYAGFEFEFDLERRNNPTITWGETVYKKSEKSGKYEFYCYVDKAWFQESFSKEALKYDVVVANYTEKQWTKDRKDNKGRAQSIDNFMGPSEIVISSTSTDKRKLSKHTSQSYEEWVVRFLHELSHSMFDHIMNGVKDVTHYWDYTKEDLTGAIKLWKLPVTHTFKYHVIHHTAVSRTKQSKQLLAVNRFHHEDRKYPISSLGYNIGYNYFIDVDGTRTQTRKEGEETMAQVGHNCDVPERCDAISTCLAGDFNVELLTDKQIEALRERCREVERLYPGIEHTFHKSVQNNRTCPGKLFTEEYLNTRILQISKPEPDEADKIKQNLQTQVTLLNKVIELLRLLITKK